MNRRERLMATLRGEVVDRPAVSFYEINGLDENPDNPDPYNIYNHPSWKPLIELARDYTDRIVIRDVPLVDIPEDPISELTQTRSWNDNGCTYIRKTIQAGKRALSQTTRRDPGVNTTWQVEHLLKDLDDLKAYLELPWPEPGGIPDTRESNCCGDMPWGQRDCYDRYWRSLSALRQLYSTWGPTRCWPQQNLNGLLKLLQLFANRVVIPYPGGRERITRSTMANLRTRICFTTLFASKILPRICNDL